MAILYLHNVYTLIPIQWKTIYIEELSNNRYVKLNKILINYICKDLISFINNEYFLEFQNIQLFSKIIASTKFHLSHAFIKLCRYAIFLFRYAIHPVSTAALPSSFLKDVWNTCFNKRLNIQTWFDKYTILPRKLVHSVSRNYRA